ncbi:hypothetical protein ACC720_32380 [Rhizobium ruizarguesonis]
MYIPTNLRFPRPEGERASSSRVRRGDFRPRGPEIAPSLRGTTAIMRTTSRDGRQIPDHASTSEGVVRAVASWTRITLGDQDRVKNGARILVDIRGFRWGFMVRVFSWRPYFVERCEHYAGLLFPARPAVNGDQPWRRA